MKKYEDVHSEMNFLKIDNSSLKAKLSTISSKYESQIDEMQLKMKKANCSKEEEMGWKIKAQKIEQ